MLVFYNEATYLIQSQDGVVILFAWNNRVVDKSKDKTEQKGRIHFLFWRQMPSFWFFYEFMKKEKRENVVNAKVKKLIP